MGYAGVKKTDRPEARPLADGGRPASEPTDLELVRRCQGGDLSAFERMVERYQDRIFNLAYRLLGHHEDAQDVTQDVFLRALEHIGEFRQEAQVYTWLFRIGVNLAISRRRRQQRVRFVSMEPARDSDEAPSFEPVETRSEPPDAAAVREEQSQQVARAIAELDEEFRAVLVLKDIEDFDYQQIGEILDLPLGTVKSRLHRARSELKARLKPIMEK